MAAKVAGTWAVISPPGIADITQVGTTKLYELGTKCVARDASSTTGYGLGEFVYLEGVANTVRGDLAYITADLATVLVVARTIGDLGVALGANVASTYGWYQVFGKGVVRSDSGITDDAALYIDGTAGHCDDTVVVGDAIQGMRAASTDDTNTIVAYINYPKVGDFDNS